MTPKEIQAFCEKHRVEIVVDADNSYLCYIDYHINKGAYCLCDNFWDALVTGIANYERLNPKD